MLGVHSACKVALNCSFFVFFVKDMEILASLIVLVAVSW